MPYRNPRNAKVAEELHNISQTHINREKEINDFKTDYEIPSQLESNVMRQAEVHGGSGFAAATVQDLGFEPTIGATSGADAPTKRRVRKKTVEVGEGLSAAGTSAAGTSAAGMAAAGTAAVGGAQPKPTRKKKGGGVSGGALLSLRDMDSMKGQPPETHQIKETLTASGFSVGSGGAKKGRGSRNEIVRDVMKNMDYHYPRLANMLRNIICINIFFFYLIDSRYGSYKMEANKRSIKL